MTTTKAKYECRRCLRFVHGADAKWRLPNRAVMTMDDNALRQQLEGPYCPHCGDELREWFEGDSEL